MYSNQRLNQPEGHPRSGSINKNEAFNAFVEDALIRKAEFDQGQNFKDALTASQYLRNHLFFVTMHMRPGLFASRDAKAAYTDSTVFGAYKNWYLRKCEQVIGPKFNKRHSYQPFSMAFLDVEGTRFGAAPARFEVPHIHALFLTGGTFASGFTDLYENGMARLHDDGRISGIDVLRYSDDGRGLGPLASYAAKHVRMNLSASRFDMLYQFYPDVDGGKYPFYKSARMAVDGEETVVSGG